MSGRTLSLLTLLLLACSPIFAEQPEVLNLQDAIQIALRNNRTIQSAQLEVLKSSDKMSAVKTRYFPAFEANVLTSRLLSPFSLTFDKGVFGDFPDIGPVPAENTNVETESAWTTLIVGTVQQPLSQIYKVKLNHSLMQAAHEESKQKEREEKQSIVNEVKKAYYAILQSQSSLRFSQQEIELYRELKRVTDDYVVQKVALKSDGMEVGARLAKAEYDTLVTRNQVEAQKERLNLLLGRDIRTKFDVAMIPQLATQEEDLDKAQRLALQQRPELLQAQWKLKEAELDAKIKKAEYIPDLSLSFNYFSPLNVDFIPDQFVSVGFYMSWDLFDWGRKGHELAEKRRTTEQARLSITEIQQRILADLNLQHRKLQESRMLIQVLQITQDAAQEKVRVATNRFKEQSVLLKDVLQAQASYEETRSQFDQAVLAMWMAHADYEKAMGMEE